MSDEQVKGNGIQSLELGIDILKTIVDSGKALNITEIATLCDMSKSKLHRYLTSFCRVGFLVKNEDLRYSVGSELILLGIKSYEQVDLNEISGSYLLDLKQQLNETAALAIWGKNGPFFIRWEESDRDIKIGIKVGSQVSITKSATGRLFAAFLPEKATPIIAKAFSDNQLEIEQFKKDVEEVRHIGYAKTEGGLFPGISAIAAPVFNQHSELVAGITIVGLTGILDISEQGEALQLLKKQCVALSKELGYKGEHHFYKV